MNIPEPNSNSYTSEPGNDAQVPVEVLDASMFSGRRADGVIEVRILQSDVKLPKNSSQYPRQISDLRRIDITEARHVASRINMGAERRGRGVLLKGHEVVGGPDEALPFSEFLLDRLTEHALGVFVIVAQRLLEALANLLRDDRRGDQLRMRMFEAGACVLSVILKNRDMRDAPAETQRVVTCFIGSQHVGDMRIRHQARKVRMVWALNDDVMNPEPSHTSPRAVNDPGRFDIR